MLEDFSLYIEKYAAAEIDDYLANLKMVERDLREAFCIHPDETLAGFIKCLI